MSNASLTAKQSEARLRQVNFWKKHQIILQHCADLSNTCNTKILVSSTQRLTARYHAD
jgi:hypothetical protein